MCEQSEFMEMNLYFQFPFSFTRFVTNKFALLSTLLVKIVFHLYQLFTYIQYKHTVFHSICKMVMTRQTTKMMDSSTNQQEREGENSNNTVLCNYNLL